MYLSELFLKTLSEEKSTLAALEACDLELKMRLDHDLGENNIIDHFFCEGKRISKGRYAELFDFFDVYNGLDYKVSREEKELQSLCREIVNISNGREIVLLKKVAEKWDIFCRCPLDEFDENAIGFGFEDTWYRWDPKEVELFRKRLLGGEIQ